MNLLTINNAIYRDSFILILKSLTKYRTHERLHYPNILVFTQNRKKKQNIMIGH